MAGLRRQGLARLPGAALVRLWLLTATEPSVSAHQSRFTQARVRYFPVMGVTRDEALWEAMERAPALKGWSWTTEEMAGPVRA